MEVVRRLVVVLVTGLEVALVTLKERGEWPGVWYAAQRTSGVAATADLRTDGTGRGKPSHAGHQELQSYRVQRSLQHTGRPRYRKLFSTASHSSGLVGDKL